MIIILFPEIISDIHIYIDIYIHIYIFREYKNMNLVDELGNFNRHFRKNKKTFNKKSIKKVHNSSMSKEEQKQA